MRCSSAGRALASSPIVRHNTACMSNNSSALLSCIVGLNCWQLIAKEDRLWKRTRPQPRSIGRMLILSN